MYKLTCNVEKEGIIIVNINSSCTTCTCSQYTMYVHAYIVRVGYIETKVIKEREEKESKGKRGGERERQRKRAIKGKGGGELKREREIERMYKLTYQLLQHSYRFARRLAMAAVPQKGVNSSCTTCTCTVRVGGRERREREGRRVREEGMVNVQINLQHRKGGNHQSEY